MPVPDTAVSSPVEAAGFLQALPQPPRKVAVVRASRIGDFICATPAFRALRGALADAEITLIALPFARPLVERSPHLDRFAAFPGFPGIAEQFYRPARLASFLHRMRLRRFDLALQLHGSGFYSNPFTLLLSARWTAGFVREEGTPSMLDAAFPYPEGLPETQKALAFMRFLGAQPDDEATEFPLWPEDELAAEALLDGAPRPLIGVHPAGTNRGRRWFPQRFAAAASELWRRHGGAIVLLGGPGEAPLAATVQAQISGGTLTLAGRTSLPVLGALIRRLDLLLTNDSGPAHIAYACRTPTVTVFGGSDPAVWGPPLPGPFAVLAHDVPCRPCEHNACPHDYGCLKGVSVEQVLSAAENLLCGTMPEGPSHG